MTQLKVKRKFNPIALKEGMVVTIRQWDDMEEEFGLNLKGNIKVEMMFTEEMREFCGTKAIVSNLNSSYFMLKGFAITLEMLEECYRPVRQLPDPLKGKL